MKSLSVVLSVLCAAAFGKARESAFMDSRDARYYKTVEIGGQVWMAENLDFEVPDSFCYDDNPDNCAKYGRLYTWTAAMGFTPEDVENASREPRGFSIGKNHQGACPVGWHIPTMKEIKLLERTLGENLAGYYLKSKHDWMEGKGGNDKFLFNGLPAGISPERGQYEYLGRRASFWIAETRDPTSILFVRAWHLLADYTSVYKYVQEFRTSAFSVRCVKNK